MKKSGVLCVFKIMLKLSLLDILAVSESTAVFKCCLKFCESFPFFIQIQPCSYNHSSKLLAIRYAGKNNGGWFNTLAYELLLLSFSNCWVHIK